MQTILKHSRALYDRMQPNRLLCAVMLFLPLFVLPAFCLTQNALLVTADGLPIGTIASSEVLLQSVRTIERDAATAIGGSYTLPLALECAPTRAAESELLDSYSLTEQLLRVSPALDQLALVTVDNGQALVCRDTAAAEQAMRRIQAQYKSAPEAAVGFVQTVAVHPCIAPTSLLLDDSRLFQTLSDTLDVTSTHAESYTADIPFDTQTVETDELEQSLQQTVQEGVAGKEKVTALVTAVNGDECSRTILERSVLTAAQDEIIEIGTRISAAATGSFMLPLTSYIVSSPYQWRNGRMHNGIDLAVDEGSPVYAADGGVVTLSGDLGDGYGNYIILDHENGLQTLYAHNSSLCVSEGDRVSQGDLIAYSGNTGNSTGPHLHFEIREDGSAVDPCNYLTF